MFCFLENPGPNDRRARMVLSRKKNSLPGNANYTTNHPFMLYYLTVLVHTKTIIHLSVSGQQ